MLEINYKKKYLELRSKYISDLDMAFRLGMEQGQQQAQQQQALEAQAQAQEMEQQQKLAEAGGMGQPGQPGQSGQDGSQPPQAEGQPGQEAAPEAGQEGEQPPQAGMENPNGSELDQHISKLESMIGGSKEQSPEQSMEIKKSLEAIKSLRKAEKFASDMKKSDLAVKGIAAALHKPTFKVGVQAQHNLTDNAKKAVSLQHKIVNDIMKAWKSEEQKAGNDIKNILNVENLIKE